VRARKIVVNARTSKMMITMTLTVPNKIRARSRRLRHVVHEQGDRRRFLLVLVLLWSPIVVVLVVRWQSDENDVFFPLDLFLNYLNMKPYTSILGVFYSLRYHIERI